MNSEIQHIEDATWRCY